MEIHAILSMNVIAKIIPMQCNLRNKLGIHSNNSSLNTYRKILLVNTNSRYNSQIFQLICVFLTK